jgi:hypothetical protein
VKVRTHSRTRPSRALWAARRLASNPNAVEHSCPESDQGSVRCPSVSSFPEHREATGTCLRMVYAEEVQILDQLPRPAEADSNFRVADHHDSLATNNATPTKSLDRKGQVTVSEVQPSRRSESEHRCSRPMPECDSGRQHQKGLEHGLETLLNSDFHSYHLQYRETDRWVCSRSQL